MDSRDLSSFLNGVFTRAGMSRRHALVVVDQLVTASIRGTDTHGIVLVERYIKDIQEGKINTSPKIRLLRDNDSTALIDGDFGAGQYVAFRATKIAMQKAARGGIGAVSVVNLSHCGPLAYYAMMLCSRRMACIAFTNSVALAAPMGGNRRVFGTNPFCFGFPYRRYPIILDAASTLAAGMKVVLASKEGRNIPPGWAIDSEGRPTTDPKAALAGALLPFGGHKGYGIMLMAELYASALSGGYLSTEIPSDRDAQGGFYVQALDIKKTRPFAAYLRDVDRLVRLAKQSSAPDKGGVLLPGEPEALTTVDRRKNGIPIDRFTWDYFLRVANEFELEPPRRLK